ncbi:SRPBCC family protein [Pedobacter deserti]|uniref:SRPBCC family protein n=1 Tax=Pedobacter deserti TaxID=2817382 RepID=UPI00210B5D7A|nr:SRPBCC family protein [Pedobacter sp. SYSU D00382]
MDKQTLKFEIIKGLILSNAFAFSSIAIASFLKPDSNVLVYTEFVVVPLLMGIICAWCWRDLGIKSRVLVLLSCLNGLIGVLLSAVFLGEGVICLLIVSPLIFTFIITGVFTGRAIFKKRNQNLNVSVVSLLLLLFFVDTASRHHYENLVSDVVIVNAPPEEVWKHVVAFDRIEEEENYWLFKMGMPSPVAASVDGYYEGAGRKCIFSNGYIFDEKMVTYKPAENLTFDIVQQPRDPEIMGHIDILRGQFILKDNGNGTTTLTGNSWYRLHVFPVWYYDLWAKSITRNVHLRVMDHIKYLSEK